MMLVVEAPEGVGVTDLEAALAAPAAAFDLVLAVRRLPDGPRPPQQTGGQGLGDRLTVSVYGADRPGIVHGVASLLAAEAVNIVDLATHVIGEADRPTYAMVLEVSLPAEVEASELRRQLEALGEELGVAVHLHRAEADVL
jgi:predicted amino acid-binding ACT domain protein